MQKVSGSCVRARSPSKGASFGEYQDHPLAQGLLPCEHSMGGVSGTSVRLRAPSKETWNGEFQACPFEGGHHPRRHAAGSPRTFSSREGAFQGDMLRGISGQSVRVRATSKGTCCMESQDHPFASGHLPEGNAVGSLRTIRTEKGTFQSDMVRRVSGLSVWRKGAFQRDMLRRVSGQSVRARAPSKGKKCGQSQDYPLARGHLQKGYAAGSVRKIRSREGFQRDVLREV